MLCMGNGFSGCINQLAALGGVWINARAMARRVLAGRGYVKMRFF